MRRRVEPELLDSLPPDHPDARHNRRDLRLTNRAMGNHAWIARTLPSLVGPGERVLEAGAGTGELAMRLIQRSIPVDGLDLWPAPPEWPEGRAWHADNLLTFAGWEAYPVILGNLIFHQFTDEELACIGRRLRNARVIVACEPLRRRVSQIAFRWIAPRFGANHVSLHDAHVSIAAGFQGRELPDALGLSGCDWLIRCHATLLGAYRMVALRRE